MFERIVTARVVIEREMTAPHTPEPVRRWAGAVPQWLEILDPQETEEISSLGKQGVRGDGDRAIIALARELGADFMILDDAKARKEAKKRGIKTLWTLEVLDEAAERGLIEDLSERLEHLEFRTSFYVGERARLVIADMKQRDVRRRLAKG
jgi:predicted nucleic acid-binding protein